MQISKEYLKGKDLEGAKRDLYAQYNTSAQNHTNHILSIGGTLLVLIGGWNLLSGELMLGYLTLAVAVVAILLTVRLMLRNTYWNIWSSQALFLTEQDIITNFNDWSRAHNWYHKGCEPYCDTVFHYAVYQSVINWRSKLKWYDLWGKLAVMTGEIPKKYQAKSSKA